MRGANAEKCCEIYTSGFDRKMMLQTLWQSGNRLTQPLYVTEQGKVDPVLMCADRLYIEY